MPCSDIGDANMAYADTESSPMNEVLFDGEVPVTHEEEIFVDPILTDECPCMQVIVDDDDPSLS